MLGCVFVCTYMCVYINIYIYRFCLGRFKYKQDSVLLDQREPYEVLADVPSCGCKMKKLLVELG